MKQLYLEIAAIGGTTFKTGVSLCNHFLGLPHPKDYLVVHKLSEQQLLHILEKLEVPAVKSNSMEVETADIHMKLVSNLQELDEQTDFSIYNIYLNPLTDVCYDPYHGIADLKNKIITAPKKIFLGNPIKMVEACRLVGEMQFNLKVETWFDIYDHAQIIKHIDPTLLRQEMEKLLISPTPSLAIKQLQETRLLEYILPELAACETVIQSKRSGVKNVFEHTMYALDACPPELDLRLTVLFHDIAKPQTLQCDLDGTIHFFKHEIVGSKIARTYLKYWNFPKEIIHKVPHLILHHMFDADPRMTDKSVRRLIRKVGKEYIYDLLKVREADRGGTPTKISMRKIKLLKRKIDKALNDNLFVSDASSSDISSSTSIPRPKAEDGNRKTQGAKHKDPESKEIIGG